MCLYVLMNIICVYIIRTKCTKIYFKFVQALKKYKSMCCYTVLPCHIAHVALDGMVYIVFREEGSEGCDTDREGEESTTCCQNAYSDSIQHKHDSSNPQRPIEEKAAPPLLESTVQDSRSPSDTQCQYCGFASKTSTTLTKHLDSCPLNPSKTHIWQCEYCGFVAKSSHGLLIHKNACRSNPSRQIAVLECSVCGSSRFTSVSGLKRHMRVCGKAREERLKTA
eukprot:Platyproteum_vivax@DN4107_c0_g1_i3.p1